MEGRPESTRGPGQLKGLDWLARAAGVLLAPRLVNSTPGCSALLARDAQHALPLMRVRA